MLLIYKDLYLARTIKRHSNSLGLQIASQIWLPLKTIFEIHRSHLKLILLLLMDATFSRMVFSKLVKS